MHIVIMQFIISKMVKLLKYLFDNSILTVLLIIALIGLYNSSSKYEKLKDEYSSLNKSFISMTNSYKTFKKLLEDEKVRSEMEVEKINSAHKDNIIKLRDQYNEQVKTIDYHYNDSINKLNSMYKQGNLSPDQVSKITIRTFLDYSNSQNDLLRESNDLLIETAKSADLHAAEVVRIKGECIWDETLNQLKENIKNEEKSQS